MTAQTHVCPRVRQSYFNRYWNRVMQFVQWDFTVSYVMIDSLKACRIFVSGRIEGHEELNRIIFANFHCEQSRYHCGYCHT
jgi:hypothetical protein